MAPEANSRSNLHVHTFISLQRHIIARYEQELNAPNESIVVHGRDPDLEAIDRVQELIHKHCQAVADLETMLRRRPAPISIRAPVGKTYKQERSYREELKAKGIELRLGDSGYPSTRGQLVKAMVSFLVTSILTMIGFMVLMVPMILILFCPGLSQSAVVLIILFALFILMGTLQAYRFLILHLEAMSKFIGRFIAVELHSYFEPMTGREIVGIVAAYAAVLPGTQQQQPPRPPNNPNPSSEGKAQPLATLFAKYRFHLIGFCLFTGLATTYIVAVTTSTLKSSSSSPSSCPCPSSQPARATASEFDRQQKNFERYTPGISSKRKKMASRAVGDVLEIAVGTGLSLPYYDWSGVVSPPDAKNDKMTSYTGLEIAPDMLLLARDRLREVVPTLTKIMRRKRAEPMPPTEGVVVDVLDSRVRLIMGDALTELPPPPPTTKTGTTTKKYDTIVQGFTLCSVQDPTGLLINMAGMVEPDTGRIVLLEHGRSCWAGFGWLNGLLDRHVDRHAEKWGCWWNRDILGIVRDAQDKVPGLEVVEVERPWLQLGTVYYLELRVNSRLGAGEGKDR
ncbi:hypothetical protein QBC47DRAFT_398491 [Echria macrotheca]|uniref:Uncharacterized protein n=1 Tax=Echria macrotheca TaxID=438768 RepID=A0AAJ0F909_9PEZI|nr:hypothetical protein QBC47DRAFT_398491 [Echria macrotheca]